MRLILVNRGKMRASGATGSTPTIATFLVLAAAKVAQAIMQSITDLSGPLSTGCCISSQCPIELCE